MLRKKILTLPLLVSIVLCFILLSACGENSNLETFVSSASITYRTEADLNEIEDIVYIDSDIVVPEESTAQDVVDQIEYHTDKANSVSFALNNVDFHTAGEYTGSCTVNVSPEQARQMVDGIEIPDDAEDVSLTVEFPVTVTAAG